VLVVVLAISNDATAHESRQLPPWLIFDVRQKKMSEAFTFLSALILTGALLAWASRVFFGDYREGFRMLYHWTSPADVSPLSDVEPRESERSFVTQFAFVGTFVLFAVLCYVALLPLFRRVLG
jgi:hypothetical protein